MRYFLDISYCGSPYHGWQIQKNAITIQETVNKALSTLLRRETICTGSGRTDTGVHAIQQMAHFDSLSRLETTDFRYKMNSLLPATISINQVTEVKDSAHARFDAISRSYQYLIHCEKNPFKTGRSYYYTQHLSAEKMGEAINFLKHQRHFKAFSKVKTDVNDYDCEIFGMSWETSGTDHRFSVSANRFLRGMVRAIVGTLLEIGQQRFSLQDLDRILHSGERSQAGRSVPPDGLYLHSIVYPEHIFLEV